MKVASPTGGRFGSVKARTRQVPVGADDDQRDRQRAPADALIGHDRARRYSTPSGRSTTSVSGTPSAATPWPSRSSAVTCTVSPER